MQAMLDRQRDAITENLGGEVKPHETRLGTRIDEQQKVRKKDKDENEKNITDICECLEKLETTPPQESSPSQSARSPRFMILGGWTPQIPSEQSEQGCETGWATLPQATRATMQRPLAPRRDCAIARVRPADAQLTRVALGPPEAVVQEGPKQEVAPKWATIERSAEIGAFKRKSRAAEAVLMCGERWEVETAIRSICFRKANVSRL